MSNVKRMEDIIVEHYREQNSKSWDETLKMIEETFFSEEEKKKFPVSLFEKHFLPFFTGEKDFNAEPQARIKWLQIADGPTNQVDLIDEKGNTVVIVPPLIDTNLIDVSKVEAGRKWKEIIVDYHQNNSIIPSLGLNGFIKDIVPKLEVLESNLVNNSSWFKLFEFFNINKKLEANKEVSLNQNNDMLNEFD